MQYLLFHSLTLAKQGSCSGGQEKIRHQRKSDAPPEPESQRGHLSPVYRLTRGAWLGPGCAFSDSPCISPVNGWWFPYTLYTSLSQTLIRQSVGRGHSKRPLDQRVAIVNQHRRVYWLGDLQL